MGSHALGVAVVSSVESGAAARAGLQPGDTVLAVDGVGIRDVIDWMWLTDGPSFTVSVVRDGEPLSLSITRTHGESLGVHFTETLFDGIRECDNACAFCFVSQLPAGLRPSLYVRDDDFRLSFLTGNFVTLTNVGDADVARIREQHLSPLHVSVHAVDSSVRARLICPTVDDRALDVLDELLDAGIEVHVQVVLVPHVNDGDILDATLEYLSQRGGVLSVGCVPMGLTAHQTRFAASYDRRGALTLIEQIGTWQSRQRPARGVGWVYAADEFYLLAGRDFPESWEYDDFPQYENGIGMARTFIDEFVDQAPAAAMAATLVTGDLFAPVLRTLIERAGWHEVRVLEVHNALFGGNVGVTGLLCGADIARAIRTDAWAGTYVVPDVVVNSDGLLLDDMPASTLGERSAADVRIIGTDATSLVEALTTTPG